MLYYSSSFDVFVIPNIVHSVSHFKSKERKMYFTFSRVRIYSMLARKLN